jgi:osmotically inducible protein OsmC
VSAAGTLDEVDGAPRITTVNITARAQVPGHDAVTLEHLVGTAADLCPVRNALRGNVDISVRSELAASAATSSSRDQRV